MEPSGPAGDGGSTGERYRFDGVVVDAVAHTLHRDGELQPLEPKAFAVLLVLLRRAGELVERDPLMDAVWGHRHVTPGVLTRAIAQLRHALGDDAHRPRFIHTQHALGYRFIGVLEVPGAARADGSADAGTSLAALLPSAPASTVPLAPPAPVPAAGPAARRSGGTDPGRWLAATGILSLVLSIVLSFGAATWLIVGTSSRGQPEASVAVLPFVSLGNTRDDDYFAEGLAVELHDALARVPGLQVVATGADAVRGERRGDLRALGRRLGVATVLDASVRREGARMRISARLADTATGVTLWSGRYDRELGDVFALQAEIAGEVVQALLGVLPRDGDTLVRRLAPTQDIRAYDAYLKGLQQLAATDGGERLDFAVAFFQEALSIDPLFARAQAGVCRAEIARFEHSRDATAFDRAEAACLRAEAMDPGLREVSLALGEMYRARGDNAKAVAQYTRTLDDIALRPAAYVGLARAQGAQGRNALALDYFARALRLRPNDAAIYRERGYHQYLHDDLPGAIASFREATRLLPDDEGQWSSLGGLYLAAGDVARAGEAFRHSLAIRPSNTALSNYGSLKYETGDYAGAADLFRHATELDPSDFRVWGNLGDALAARPASAAQATPAYRRAADMAAAYLEIRTDDAQALAQLAWYLANLGDGPAARVLLRRAEATGREPAEVAFWNAQTLALLGDAAGARARVAQARTGGVPVQRLRASPVLKRLQVAAAVHAAALDRRFPAYAD